MDKITLLLLIISINKNNIALFPKIDLLIVSVTCYINFHDPFEFFFFNLQGSWENRIIAIMLSWIIIKSVQ